MSEPDAKTKVLTKADVESKLIKLRAAEPDKKVDLIQFFGLELEEVAELPESTIDPLTLSLPPLIRSSHPLLLSSTLISFLPFYIPLIPLSPLSHLRLALLQILPALLERLNDPKDRVHTSAANTILSLGIRCFQAEPLAPPFASGIPTSIGGGSGSASASAKGKEKETLPQTWERYMKDTLTGKAPRTRVEAMKVLVRIRAELGGKFGLKAWLAPIVDLLEDGDGNVREQAKETVVALLSPVSTPPAARSELKKLLLARNVRKTISSDIITRVLGGGDSGRTTPAFPPSGAETPREESAASVPSATSAGRPGAATPAIGGGDDVEIVYIASPHDLANEFAAMIPFFEGKETEQNWLPREKSTVRIRGMLKGGVWGKYSDAFVAGLKSGIMEGISKTIVSLRTTVAQQSCFLLKELVENLGPGFDPFVENILPILGKMAGFTKKIIAERSQACLTAIIIHSTVHPRLLIGHITAGVAEKNIQTRHFCAGHLKTYLDMHGAKSKHTIETAPNLLDQLEGGIKKALSDVNPAVRDLGRQSFWSYSAVWTQRASVIMNGLDGMARKQLEKANPGETNIAALTSSNGTGAVNDSSYGGAGPAAKAAPAAKRASSSVAALLAEKRRAKAAELAAGKMAQESPRIVSGPVPNSPSLNQGMGGMPRSNSSASLSSKSNRPDQLARSITSPEQSPRLLPDSPGASSSHSARPSLGSPTPSSTKSTPKPVAKAALSSPRDLLAQNRDRSSSLGRSSPSRGSPNRDSPLRQSSTLPYANSASTLRSPGTSSTTSNSHPLRTPQSNRKPLPTVEAEQNDEQWLVGGVDINTPSRSGGIVDDLRRAQAAQAESAAQQLMEYSGDEQGYNEAMMDASEDADPVSQTTDAPSTPARHNTTNGHGHHVQTQGSAFKTPLNIRRSRAWEDSPRPEAVTPLMMARLKERHHERSWWVKRQELMEKATPLKPSAPAPSSAVSADVEALESGQAVLRNLQKLALFSTSHPLRSEADNGDDVDVHETDDGHGGKAVWVEGRVFERILKGLLEFLRPTQDKELLEQALVLLWEMVQHQWGLFDGHEQELLESLFGLRASHDATILESTNALISLLTQIADPMYLLTLLRAALNRFLPEHPAGGAGDAKSSGTIDQSLSRHSLSGSRNVLNETLQDRIRSSGYVFGLTGLGMCVLRLPEAVIEVEGGKLGEVIMAAMSSTSSIVRQSANFLILSIQTILVNSSKTLSFVPNLSQGQKDLIIYYMAQNGILESSPISPVRRAGPGFGRGLNHDDDEEEEDDEEVRKKDKMMREMEGLMGRAIIRDREEGDEEEDEEEGPEEAEGEDEEEDEREALE